MARCVPPYVRKTANSADPYGDLRVSETEGSRWLAFIHDTMPPAPSPAAIEAGRAALVERDRLAAPHVYPRVSAEKTKKERRQDKRAAKEKRRKQQTRRQRIKYTLFHKPHVPLVLRTIIFILSIGALGLAIQTFQHGMEDPSTHKPVDEPTRLSSPVMAIVVDVIALPYVSLIMFDEWYGKPIGLRLWYAKLRIIYLDILFIIFESANLALAFEFAQEATMRRQYWAAHEQIMTPEYLSNEKRHWALACVLLVALVAWTTTFMISVLRVVTCQTGRQAAGMADEDKLEEEIGIG